MILAGFVIAVGVVVDDAIIDIENIVRRLRQHRRGGQRPSRPPRSSSTPRSRCAAPIVYATLIDRRRRCCRCSSSSGLSGAFFQPLAISLRAGGAGLAGRRPDRHAGAGLILLRKAPLERRESPLVRAGCSAATQRVLGRDHPPARAGLRRRRRHHASPAWRSWPLLGQSLLPDFKERDFLMHWVTEPGTSHPEMVRITDAGQRRAARRSPACATSAPTSARRCWPTRSYGINFGENWISVDPSGRLRRRRSPPSRRWSTAIPGLYRDVQTYLKERIREVLTGVERRDRRPHLRRRPGRRCATRPSEVEDDPRRDRRRRSTCTSQLQVDIPQIEVEVDLAAAADVRPQAGRRAPGGRATLLASEEVGDIFRGGTAYDVSVWSDARESRQT